MPEFDVIEPFSVAADDPLVAEHIAVSACVEAGAKVSGAHYQFTTIDLKSFPSGQVLLTGSPEESRRIVIAALLQIHHWETLSKKVMEQAKDEIELLQYQYLPGWEAVWGRRRTAEAVIRALLRRKLPFEESDLLALIAWCRRKTVLRADEYPLGVIVRAIQQFAADRTVSSELSTILNDFGGWLRDIGTKELRRLSTVVEQIGRSERSELKTNAQPTIAAPPRPAAAGTPNVLIPLKQILGMLPESINLQATEIGPDRFSLPEGSPLQAEHELLSALFAELVSRGECYAPKLQKIKIWRTMLEMKPQALGRVLLAAVERFIGTLFGTDEKELWEVNSAVKSVAASLLECDYSVDRNGAIDLLLSLTMFSANHHREVSHAADLFIEKMTHEANVSPLLEGERFVLSLWRASLVIGPDLGVSSEAVQSLTRLINDDALFVLTPGEVWSDAVNEDFTRFPQSARSQWCELMRHALSAVAARPSSKWSKVAKELISAIGPEQVSGQLIIWLPLVSHGRSIHNSSKYHCDRLEPRDTMNDENANALRGLLWCIPLLSRNEKLTRAITAVGLSAYKKVPGIGPRAVKVGNAAVYALAELGTEEAVGQLAILKVRVKFGTAQKQIEKAFDTAADALGLPREEIEELGVPSYGLEEIGVRREEIGEYRAELRVTGSDAELLWFDANGKALKSVPAKVKSDFKEDLADLKQSLKDIQAMLPAQRDRIDGLFLAQKCWAIDVWSDRYLNHPLVGTIARRLLWCVDGTPAIFADGFPVDIEGNSIAHGKTAEITLWHPVGRTIEEITGWRRQLEEHGITQPFKQAHRELYLLTDAERSTNTYSNRFAAHVLRQHQFNALCAARGWKNKLRLMVDDTYPPATKELPQWGFRAEYWVEGIGDDYGTDTNESGVYLRLATDQVRFYRTGAAANSAHAAGGGYENRAAGPGTDDINEPVSLEQVPELVFSEIMRDVDLFVGVSSVGNDPNWQDGGPEGRYVDYWQSYSFGELSGTATTRKQVLERLIPRLKIADRCSFSDRFLVVRGELRTYKIHLGSGNILMEPNDQYLCIVANRKTSNDDLYLPFEGDATLSLIISKALMLADDLQIKDSTITSQINKK